MYKPPGQNNMLTGAQNAQQGSALRPPGLKRSSPPAAAYPAQLPAPQPMASPETNTFDSVAAHKVAQAAGAPMVKPQQQSSGFGNIKAQAIQGMQQGASALGRVPTPVVSMGVGKPMYAGPEGSYEIPDAKAEAEKQTQKDHPIALPDGQGGFQLSDGTPVGADGTPILSNKTGAVEGGAPEPTSSGSGSVGSSSGSGTGDGFSPDMQALAEAKLKQLMDQEQGIPQDVQDRYMQQVEHQLAADAGNAKQAAGFNMGAAGLAGSGLSVSGLADIDAKAMLAAEQARGNLQMEDARLTAQERNQHLQAALQMAIQEGNWEQASKLQAQMLDYQRENMLSEAKVQIPQTIMALAKEMNISPADFQAFYQHLSSAQSVDDVLEMAARWSSTKDGTHYQATWGDLSGPEQSQYIIEYNNSHSTMPFFEWLRRTHGIGN